MYKRNIFLILTAAVIFLAGCTTTQKGTSIGALTGAALGGIVGHQSDKGAEGAAIGGAVGALGGYVVGEKMKKKYCPQGGKQYDESVNYCPVHGVELKYIN
ncbi:MAG: glycine zipper 2TM domain-containing protein [Candidatus Omnitrophica bacterium]|nr:glycine zipper 2TM domain-containing protein [Candidatus Omnitrophota bacterium]